MHKGTIAVSPSATYQVSIVGPMGPLQIYGTPDGRMFVAGTPGQSYQLLVKNLLHRRIEVITSIDGKNTLKDEDADAANSQGMVLHASREYLFSGWRIDMAHTRQFHFGAPETSVAARTTGSTENVGVIGFAAYREQEPEYITAHVAVGAAGGSGSSFGAAAGGGGTTLRGPSTGGPGPGGQSVSAGGGRGMVTNSSPGLGTGIGKRGKDVVGTTTFNRVFGPPDVVAIQYDTLENLARMGITVTPMVPRHDPNPFPGGQTGYAEL